jgi:hypothetical protein
MLYIKKLVLEFAELDEKFVENMPQLSAKTEKPPME